MSNNYFTFKQFTVYQDRCAFKVGTDGVLLGACTNISEKDKILDIGTGTGLIALMLAQKGGIDITAIEPDKDSFEQACQNVEASKWSNRIRLENTDLQNYKPKNKFSLIVSNPPYFINSLKNPDLRKASSRHNDSLSSTDLLKGVSELLAEDGRFQIILPYIEGNIFIAEAAGYGLYCNSILKIRPLPTSDIRRMILTFTRKRASVNEKFLTIERGARHEFTEDYIEMTKEFYLNF
jgi:tRNA1Val (adenine37-N6)-methyltransferase